MKEALLERFLRYVQIDTQSDDNSATCPSTAKQWDLINLLHSELRQMGLAEISLDTNGYLMATLPATKEAVPVIGFIAHVDTSPDFSSEKVKPKLTENYDGGDVILCAKEPIVLSPKDFPVMHNYHGMTLVTTKGHSLLGADDKAGIAEILTAIAYLQAHPEIEHGKIRIGFTPDEEIGRGADLFDVAKFGAQYAYTLDGGEEGELEYENFNAAGAKISIQGRSIHPGTAKNSMVNSQYLAMELNALLPATQRPEHTEYYEGFFMLSSISGGIAHTEMKYIIRDHDATLFQQKKELLQQAVAFMNHKYGPETIKLELNDQYYNMREKVEPVRFIVDIAHQAMLTIGVEPKIKPIRGGTDGSRLSYMGLPTPNLFTGGHNYHGPYEFVVVESMLKATELIVEIARGFANYQA
jgi:tripeptide aminopeptidase